MIGGSHPPYPGVAGPSQGTGLSIRIPPMPGQIPSAYGYGMSQYPGRPGMGISGAGQGLTPEQRENLAKAEELRQILNNLEKVDDESRRGSLLDNVCSKEDVLNLPVHPDPPGIASGDLKVNLLKHQVWFSVLTIIFSSHNLKHSYRAKLCGGALSTKTRSSQKK
jgi:SWI/SNF-related matrix-associated actin-dependent regulator of chromatin subfamily A3